MQQQQTTVVTTYRGEITIPGSCSGEYVVVRSFTATDNVETLQWGHKLLLLLTTAPELILHPTTCRMFRSTSIIRCSFRQLRNSKLTVTTDTISGTCPNEYIVTRAFSASDECGNISSGIQTITSGAIVPVHIVPADYTAECSDEQPITMLPHRTTVVTLQFL